MINHYLSTTYKPFARGPQEFDCWGLVRDAWQKMFNRQGLPSYADIDPEDKVALTMETYKVMRRYSFEPVDIRAGAIATAWRANLCVHVGIVVEADGVLWILETDVGTGPCLTRPSRFEGRYTRVVYYDY